MKIYKFSQALIVILFPLALFAQKKDAEKYQKAAAEIRQQVWAWDKPQFQARTIPSQYANDSKVIIAQHTELDAESKTKSGFSGLTFSVQKQQTITEVVRELVKLNDKAAIDEYAELSFIQLLKLSGFNAKNKLTTYFGVKVIKPDGAVREINADDVVLTKDETSEKRAKLAIPDLQPGDILDYFIATELVMTDDFTTHTYNIPLFNDAPTLYKSFHGQFGKKYNIEYRSYNDAPELKVVKNDDGEIVMDVEKNNIPTFETSLWVNMEQQLPFIRMNIAMGGAGFASGYEAKKPGVISKNTDPQQYLKAEFDQLYKSNVSTYELKDLIVKDAKRLTKQMGFSFDKLSEIDKAGYLYYAFRFKTLMRFKIDDLANTIGIGKNYYDGYALMLFATLREADLNASLIFSNSRMGVRMTELMSAEDIFPVTYLPSINKYLSIQTVYDIPFEVPEEIEGLKNTKNFKLDPGPDAPESEAVKNAHIENLAISITPENNAVAVKRQTIIKGHFKADLQKQLITYEDLYESERKAFNEENSLIEELKDSKDTRKYADEVINAFAEARKKQKEATLQEVKDEFDQDVTEFNDFKIDTLGVRHTAPNLVFSSSFKLGGILKKAGNNLILEVGKIQGTPLKVKQEQRKRDIDVYMPYARSIEYNISIEIPEGYTAEGINALNKKVANETGFFETEASTMGKIITIKVKKHYLHNFEPAANWDKLLEFIDASNDWLNAKILLKKI